ncbi:MAG: amidase family protein, partial [Gammaproteobacteria bacterium]|nr:amidase family protein [Gammaproteobacteria bacterium]
MPHRHTLTELAAMLRAREISALELTDHFLGRIEGAGTLNAFITVAAERARDQARAADRLLAGDDPPPLAGLPIAHKDIFCTAGLRTSCGSRMLDNFVSPYDA